VGRGINAAMGTGGEGRNPWRNNRSARKRERVVGVAGSKRWSGVGRKDRNKAGGRLRGTARHEDQRESAATFNLHERAAVMKRLGGGQREGRLEAPAVEKRDWKDWRVILSENTRKQICWGRKKKFSEMA